MAVLSTAHVRPWSEEHHRPGGAARRRGFSWGAEAHCHPPWAWSLEWPDAGCHTGFAAWASCDARLPGAIRSALANGWAVAFTG
ncbi:MAG TPA: hypothetical protein VI854_05435 [Acidimicrobiia bacterium]|nr:hypothetical protein [Acidimicrobiia bacterium]